jgi:hypothetical protein
VSPQIPGSKRRAVPREVVRRTDHPAPNWTQPTRHQAGIGQIRDAQCDINAASNQIHHPVIELKLYNDLGIGSQKVWQCRCHMAQAKRHWCGQAHPAVRNCRRGVGFGLYCLALGEDAGRAYRQDASRLGQRKAARRAMDQTFTQPSSNR